MHLSKIKEKFSDCLVLPVNPHEEHDHTRCFKMFNYGVTMGYPA